jgi:5,10-methylenetetrahydromethanopterin reductase
MPLRLACLLAPGPQTVEHALLAEALGYDRVWLADSPALWQDIWARMALVAAQTHRVQLGTAVLIPSLRHVVTQAAAIATIADIAPGRLTVGLATGFTGRAALGQHKRLPWAFVKRYVQQLRGLLHGEQVEVDGALCQLIPSLGFMPPRPITVPISLAASGPRGYQVAREVADGIINPGRPRAPTFRSASRARGAPSWPTAKPSLRRGCAQPPVRPSPCATIWPTNTGAHASTLCLMAVPGVSASNACRKPRAIWGCTLATASS